MVTVSIFAYAAAYDGPREFTAELPEDVKEAVDRLLVGPCAAFKKDFGTVNHLLINGRNYHLTIADKIKLKAGDNLTLVSLFCGG